MKYNIFKSKGFMRYCNAKNLLFFLIFLLCIVFVFSYNSVAGKNKTTESEESKKIHKVQSNHFFNNREDFMHIKKYRPSSDLTISKHFSRPFFQLQNEIDRLFDDVFSDFGSFVQPSRDLITRDSSFVPSLNFAESSKEYTVMVDIPGVDEKNIKIEASNGTLSITGEKNFEAEDKDKNFYRMERSYGSFERRLAIPDDAKEDDISAEFKNGVLQIKIPRDKEKESKVKKIDIKKR